MNIHNFSHKDKEQKKKVILQIVAHGPADKSGKRSTNGPEIRALRSLDYHDKEKFKFIICYSSKGNLWNDFKNHKEIELIDFSVESKYQFSAISKLIQIVKNKKVDLIHTQGPGSLDFFAAVAAYLTKTPLIVTRPVMLDDWIRPVLNKKIYKLFDNIVLNIASFVVAVSKAGVKYLIEKSKIKKNKVVLIYNGVDIDFFKPIKRLTKKSDKIYIGTCAQMSPHKGWADFLKVIDFCTNEFTNLEFIIVGDGPIREEIISKAQRMGILKKMKLAGYQRDIRPYLYKMDIFLMTSWSEGLPVAIIEAMATGLPVVATDVGGVSELVIHEKTGYLCQAKKPEKIAAYVLKLIKNPDLREEFGSAGRNRAMKYFSIQRMVNEYENLYINCLKK